MFRNDGSTSIKKDIRFFYYQELLKILFLYYIYIKMRWWSRLSMMNIHPTAVVDEAATLHDKVKISPFCVVGPRVELKMNVTLNPYAIVQGQTVIEEGTSVHSFACIGTEPQNKKNGLSSRVRIGQRCVIRENVTINAGTLEDTVVGNDCWILTGAHVGHDAQIGNNVVISNGTQIAGHVKVGEHSVLGGQSGLQQFCVIGRGSMISGGSFVDRHVPPYSLVLGNRAQFRGINIRGLRRRQIPNSHILALIKASRQVFFTDSSSNVVENAQLALTKLDPAQILENSLAHEFLSFIAEVGKVQQGWCDRRAAMGIIPPPY